MMAPSAHPAYRILSERLVIRCYDPRDAESVNRSINENREHLRRFLPFADLPPETDEQVMERLRTFRGKFDLGVDFTYGIFDRESDELIGGAGLHPRCGPGGIEIGYWIVRERTRQGLATEAAAVLTATAFEVLKVDRVEIRIDPENLASKRVPEKLGYTREGVLRRRLQWNGGTFRDLEMFCLFNEDYPESPSASFPVEAFDAIDRPLISRSS